jgi:hypothetical protein
VPNLYQKDVQSFHSSSIQIISYTTCPKIKPYKSNEEKDFKISINQVMNLHQSGDEAEDVRKQEKMYKP